MKQKTQKINETPKQTQGQIKKQRLLKSLFQNNTFKKELNQILEIKNPKKVNKQLWGLAKKYNIDYSFGSPLLDLITEKKVDFNQLRGYDVDVCQLYDVVDEFLNPNFPLDFNLPPSKNPEKRAQFNNYPLHIGISKYASQRDIVDFVKKHWEDIESYFANKPRIPRIKPMEERNELIWTNKDLPVKDVLKLLEKKYPDNTLTYTDISKIIYDEKKLRNSEQV